MRRVCKACKTDYQPSEEVLWQLGLQQDDVKGNTFSYGTGCDQCNDSGYRGRVALFEIMEVTPRLRRGILEGWSQNRLKDLAIEEGMRPLREAGLLRIYEGLTTAEEVIRETFIDG